MFKVRSFLIAGLLIALPLIASGQSDTSQSREGPIQIDADSGEYDNRLNAYKLFGNVRISHGSLTVSADEGFAYQTTGEDERVELFGQPTQWSMVLDDGTEANGQSDQIVYNLTQGIIVMLGNARVEDSRGVFTGTKLTYNLESQKTEGEGGVQVVIDPPNQSN
ncbi:MAG TPA: lipopolysaccharide transport periplasmic protein LptA [Wenzhouxiangella sp.]